MRLFPDILPAEFGLVLLTLALVITLAPYAAGHDFGILRIPAFPAPTLRRLKVLGPLALAIALLAHVLRFDGEAGAPARDPVAVAERTPGEGPPGEPRAEGACTRPVLREVTDAERCGTTRETYVIEPRRPRTCRDPSFGRTGWSFSEDLERNSGWVGGGRDQPWWCSAMIARFLAQRSIDSQHEATVIASGERARWTGPFGRTREYNYSCRARIAWGPIHGMRADGSVCGWHPPVLGEREIPATCEVQVDVETVPC